MADDPKPERKKASQEQEPETRPVADHEPLTVTVVEPTTSDETAVQVTKPAATRIPHAPVPRLPERPSAVPVPRWYWLLVILTAALLYANYRMVWAERIHYWMDHRLLPRVVVRAEHSIWRHTFGHSKAVEG